MKTLNFLCDKKVSLNDFTPTKGVNDFTYILHHMEISFDDSNAKCHQSDPKKYLGYHL